MADEQADDHVREWWWIASDRDESWAGVRIAIFIVVTGTPCFMILGEVSSRLGLRDWSSVSEREGWVKVARIPLPTADEIAAALQERVG